MELLSIVVMKDKVEEIVSHLLKKGIFHPVDVRRIEEELDQLSPYQMEQEHAEWDAQDSRLRRVLRKLNRNLIPQARLESFSLEEISGALEKIEGTLDPLAVQKEELQETLKTKQNILSQIKDYFPLPIRRGSLYTFIEVSVGRLEEKSLPVLERSLEDVPHVVYPFRRDGAGLVSILMVGLKRDRALLDKVLKDLAWQKIEYPQESPELAKAVEGQLDNEIRDCQRQIREIDRKIESLGQDWIEKLSSYGAFTSLKQSLLEAKRFSCTTEATVILSGWVPVEGREDVVREIRSISDIAYVEEKSPEETIIPRDEVPVKLVHNAFFKPFELLIGAYGIPRYGTVDPTIFVAITFLLMFGAMFGDVGHGLVLALLSLLLRSSKSETAKQASALIFYCGISAMVFGALYGDAFGFDFPSLWMKPIDNIMGFFKISVFFGIGVITLGIIFNVINALKDKDYLKALFDKSGLITGVIYWVAIAWAAKALVGSAAIPKAYFVLIFTGIVLLFIKPFIEMFVHKKKESFFVALMESAIDVMEVIMGYLANTVSFIRIGAFALAHTGLFIAIFEISRILKGVGGDWASVTTLVLGNILIIGLEGLVVSIQSVRLNYYEFFSKFFIPGKELYKPLTLGVKE